MKKTIVIILISVLFATSILAPKTVWADPAQKVDVIIGFNTTTDAGLVRSQGGKINHEFHNFPFISCNIPVQAVEALKNNPKVTFVEEDTEVTALVDYASSWGVVKIGAKTVYEYDNSGEGINVAVIDTGINRWHEDLKSAYAGGYDFVNDDNEPWDDNGHGTHCAGIIAANSTNGLAVAGVAPGADIYALKVFNSQGSGLTSYIIEALDWAIDTRDTYEPIQIISMSLGSSVDNDALKTACDTANNNGIVVVAAAGNNGAARRTPSSISYPARYDSVIAVGSTDQNNVRASTSSTGPELDLMAPGVYILSDYIDTDTTDDLNYDTMTMSGTSMACPHVAGTAALLLKANPSLTPDQILTILKETAIDLGKSGFDNYYGYGRIDAAAAVAQCAPALTVNIDSPTPDSTVKDTVTVQASISNQQDPVSVTYTVGTTSDTMAPSGSGVYTDSWDTTALPDGRYTLQVTATDSAGSTKATINVNVDNKLPAKVTELSATATSATQISLTWKPNTELDLKGYNIYRGITKTELSPVAFVDAKVNSFIDSGLNAYTTYYYKVTAQDQAGGQSQEFDVVYDTTDPLPEIQTVSASIAMSLKTIGQNTYATATVTIRDASGSTLSGAIVTGQWGGATNDQDKLTTNTNGVAVLQSDNVRRAISGTTIFAITITDVVLDGYTYDSTHPATASITK